MLNDLAKFIKIYDNDARISHTINYIEYRILYLFLLFNIILWKDIPTPK